MKKSKVLFPVLAFIFAIASAFATVTPKPFVQRGWYDSNGPTTGGGMEADISDPAGNSPQCSVSATNHICKITVGLSVFDAYNNQGNAEAGGATGLLKYN